jgi:hypothetical protein
MQDHPSYQTSQVERADNANDDKKIESKPGEQEIKQDEAVPVIPPVERPVAVPSENIPEMPPSEVNEDAHVFYYSWYGNPEFNGEYYHWNHPLLPHWDAKEAAKWPKGRHKPPADVGASFYPELGPYSSSDPAVMEQHMLQIKSAGIGTSTQSLQTRCDYFWLFQVHSLSPGTHLICRMTTANLSWQTLVFHHC